MNVALRSIAVTLTNHCPIPVALQPNSPVVLVYHGISARPDRYGMDAAAFERQMAYLKKHFSLVAPGALGRMSSSRQIDVLLTFDDGFRNNAELVAPILRKYELPAVFFVSSRHIQSGKYLWFAYLRALERYFPGNGFTFGGRFMDMSPTWRRSTMRRLELLLLDLKPHPAALYGVIDKELPCLEDFVRRREIRDCCAGMTESQIRTLAADPLFTIGAHTVDHPFLTKCEPDEVVRQIAQNQEQLEQITGVPCPMFAYPASDYNGAVLGACRDAGFHFAHSGHRRIGAEDRYEVPRVGIYYPSLKELDVKIRWSQLILQLRRRTVRRSGAFIEALH